MEKASWKWVGKEAVLGVCRRLPWPGKEELVGVAEGLGKFQSTELEESHQREVRFVSLSGLVRSYAEYA